jgi:hypothetical protein
MTPTQPTPEALRWVEENHPDASDAEKWRLAQAQTLLNDPQVQEFSTSDSGLFDEKDGER